jgi:LmbE family N-acetylglucosaminyl deacetylase
MRGSNRRGRGVRLRGRVASAVLRSIALVLAVVALLQIVKSPPDPPDALAVRDGERLLVVAPHPDDESLAASGLIQRVLARRGQVRVALVTAGDANIGGVVLETGLRQPPAENFVAYGERRVAEARDALRTLGVPPDGLEVLGFPDGALMPLLSQHWHRAHPARSATTGASDPPYAFAIDPDITYDGSDLRDELARALEAFKPTLIALPDPLDRHPDHRASGVFAMLAIDEWIGGRWPRREPPRVLTYLVHWPDWPPGWDGTPPADADGTLTLPSSLPERPLDTATLTLLPAEIATKRAALAAHATQQHAMGPFLAAFVRRTEPFTIFDATEIRSIASAFEPGFEQEVHTVRVSHAG